MFLKVRYPLEFFAAAMTVAGDDEKVAASVLDARSASIEIVPPDINQSSDRIEIVGDKLYAPFQAIKGISERTAGFIVAARKALKEGHYAEADGSVCVVAPSSGGFTSKGHFEAVLTNLGTLGKVNSANRERLERVGAFASVTPGAKPATHLDRLKDRLELMPGFTVDAVKADRSINAEREAQTLILRVISDYRACDVCDFAGNPHVNPTIGKKPVFMMVSDSPNWKEEKAGRMVEGDTAIYLKAALKDADMNINDGYYTALVKAMKPSGMKVLPADAINGCSQFLDREIDILKPAIIVAMGSNAIRKFAPGVKGAPGELVGKAIYDPKLDATIIFGFNLAQLAFDPSKAVWLQKICAKIAELAK